MEKNEGEMVGERLWQKYGFEGTQHPYTRLRYDSNILRCMAPQYTLKGIYNKEFIGILFSLTR